MLMACINFNVQQHVIQWYCVMPPLYLTASVHKVYADGTLHDNRMSTVYKVKSDICICSNNHEANEPHSVLQYTTLPPSVIN